MSMQMFRNLTKNYYYLLHLLFFFVFFGCKKQETTEKMLLDNMKVSGIDSLYVIKPIDTLHIKPNYFVKGGDFNDTTLYEIKWATYDIYRSDYKIIRSNNLTYTPNNTDPINQKWYLRLTDKKTGVFVQKSFDINIFNYTNEGFYVLSDIGNEKARLGMLSYNPSAKKFVTVPDIINEMESSYIIEGKPLRVNYVLSRLNYISSAINLITDKKADQLNPETLNFEGNLIDAFPASASFSPDKTSSIYFLYSNIFNLNGKLYAHYKSSNNIAGPLISSTTSPNDIRFSSQMAGSLGYLLTPYHDVVVFDENNQSFMLVTGLPSDSPKIVPMGNGKLFNFNVNKKLLSLKYSNYLGGSFYAILKDNESPSYYLAVFKASGVQSVFKKLDIIDFQNVHHFDISAEFGYLIYSIGSKVYEYDPSSDVNELMIDFGNDKISYISTPPTLDVDDLNRTLIIATYDENDMKSSGTIGIFKIPGGNGKLELINQYTGFGKVVDMDYKLNF